MGPASSAGQKPTIAVFNSSEDTVELLRTVLEAEGFQTVVGHIPDVKKGEMDLIEFVNHHTPAVIIYDISPPYDANWRFLRLVRSVEPLKPRQFVITTTNKPALESLVGANDALEIIGKPYDLVCTKPDGTEKHVEVKGTTGAGAEDDQIEIVRTHAFNVRLPTTRPRSAPTGRSGAGRRGRARR